MSEPTTPLPGGERLPRPERTPDALRVALARVAPHRLPEMERQKNEAFQLAAQSAHLGPIQGWLTVWAGEVEVERRPDLLARRHAAGRAPTGRRPGPGRPTGSGGRRDLMCS